MSGLVQKFKEMWSSAEEDYDYEEEEEVSEEEETEGQGIGKFKDHQKKASSSGNRVVNIHATTRLQVVLFKPERFGEETRNIADELLKMHTIVLNLEDSNKDASRRIIDFLSGVAYANGGKIKKVATDTFVITPYNVELTGVDVLDELENSGVYI